jgi:pimeloyl-ACP methyl ester carboxylesterase
MPALARDFEVIAVDQRGIGLSDKPEEGYDTGTLANDLVGLMDALGHEQFAVVGVDTGMLIGYALAADHPDRVVRVALGEAPLPGITPPTPLVLPDQVVDRLWHIPFNQLKETNEKLVAGREDIFFGASSRPRPGRTSCPTTPSSTTSTGSSSPEALHGSFQLYRAFGATTAQNESARPAGCRCPSWRWAEPRARARWRGHDEAHRRRRADPRHPGIGHWLAEQAPEELLAALTTFLAPYRDTAAAAQGSRPLASA